MYFDSINHIIAALKIYLHCDCGLSIYNVISAEILPGKNARILTKIARKALLQILFQDRLWTLELSI